MATTPKEMTLANLGGGALMECATVELRKICNNIADPNVKTSAKRKLRIDITIEPDERGQVASISYEVKVAMPGPDAGKTMAHVAYDPLTEQLSLFEVETHPPLFEPQAPLAAVPPLDTKRA